jgi:hypothetical protein
MDMKNLTVLISGAPEGDNLRDLEIESGTTAGDVLKALNLRGYLLSQEGSAQAFAAEEQIYDQVADGTKLRATPIAEVGWRFWSRLRIWLGLAPPRVVPRGQRRAVRPEPRQIAVTRNGQVRPRTSNNALRVERNRSPLWQTRGWRRVGATLQGAYRTPRGSFMGEVDLANPYHPQFFITNPPKALLKGSHQACFRRRGGGKYYVHFGIESPELDAGIVAIEKLLVQAL